MKIKASAILWPTDFSEHAAHAAPYARAFCELFGGRLHVIHIVDLPLTPDGTGMIPAEYPMATFGQEFMESARSALARTVEKHFAGLPHVTTEALLGNPWQGVCEYASTHGIDLIVITTHGRRGLSHLLIGSTAERIVQHAPCPVFTIKSGARELLA